MPKTSATNCRVTARDLQIFDCLDRTPLTATQLLKFSQTFGSPFQSIQRVRSRLASLREFGLVQSWPYAIAERGTAPEYFKLTLSGHRLLFGSHAEAPTRRAFSEIAVGRHNHTRRLADFIVHMHVAAHTSQLRLLNFQRENSLSLNVNGERLFPDGAFQLQADADSLPFNFMIELDNSTESVRSTADVDSWARKIRVYEDYQDAATSRFRVIIVTTRSSVRLKHILRLVRDSSANLQRNLFCGIFLNDWLNAAQPLSTRCFWHPRGFPMSLLPQSVGDSSMQVQRTQTSLIDPPQTKDPRQDSRVNAARDFPSYALTH